jgi:hypothetical protein
MRRLLGVFLGMVCAASAALAQPTVTTTASFTRYFGDAPSLDDIGGFTFINDVPVPQDLPPNLGANDFPQGQLLLPPGTTSVEFKNGTPADMSNPAFFNPPSLLAWAPATSVIPGDGSPFKFGTLTITNGIFFFEANFDVTFTTSASDGNPTYDNKTFSDTLRYTVTPNTGSDADNADTVKFLNHPDLRGFPTVFEAGSSRGNTGTVELWGTVGSLDPLFFANPTGGVVIQSAVAAVPEPSHWLLMLAGMAALTTTISRRRAPRAG